MTDPRTIAVSLQGLLRQLFQMHHVEEEPQAVLDVALVAIVGAVQQDHWSLCPV
jgi:hypothetical protein